LVSLAHHAWYVNAAAEGHCSAHYWLDRGPEVDFVISTPATRLAIEVKSGRAIRELPGLQAFSNAFGATRMLVVGGDGMSVEEFLSTPVRELMRVV